MKRLVVTLAHPQHAGMLRALRVLEDASARHGWTIDYVVPRRTPLLDETGIPAARTHVLAALGAARRGAGRVLLPWRAWRLAQLARGADCFYSTTLSTLPVCRLAAAFGGPPTVVHVYSSYGDARSYRKHGLAQATHVVAPSADSLALAERALGGFAPGVRATVAYNGMDVTRIVREAGAPPPAALASVGGPRIGMVGNLDWRKNPRLLVEALPRIRAAVPEVRALLIGAFPDAASEAALRARVTALGLDDAVVLTGFLANPFPLVRTLDVLVHPALRDPFPLALLEGMALERPIVAAAVGGIPEMLVDGTSGVLVPPDDAAALADAVIALLRDPARREAIGRAARARLDTDFTLDGWAATMFAAFDAAATARRSAA